MYSQLADCDSLGLERVGFLKSDCIGPKKEFTVVFVDRFHRTYVTITWDWAITDGVEHESIEAWATSKRTNGEVLRTAQTPDIGWQPELLPRNWKVKRVLGESIEDLFVEHERRIAAEVSLIPLHGDTLPQVHLTTVLELVDYLIELKILVSLTPDEVSALKLRSSLVPRLL